MSDCQEDKAALNMELFPELAAHCFVRPESISIDEVASENEI